MRSGVFLQETRLTIVLRILRASFKNLQVTRDREVRKRIFKEEKSIKNRCAKPQCDVNLASSTWEISSRAINRRRYIFPLTTLLMEKLSLIFAAFHDASQCPRRNAKLHRCAANR